MSITGKLLTRILDSPSNFLEARRAGISSATFHNEIEQEVWSFIEEYFNKHKAVPPLHDVKRRVPLFVPQDPGNRNISELIESVYAAHIEAAVAKAMAEANSLIKQGRHTDAILVLQRGAAEAASGFARTSDGSLASTAEMILRRYRAMKEGGFYHGVPWPWKPLQDATGGIESGTYNVLYGRPKSTKTWRLLQIAVEARRFGNKVLFVSNELPVELVFNRILALECGFPYEKYRKGELSQEEELVLESYVEMLKATPPDQEIVVTTLSDSENAKTISALRAKIDQHEPKIILIDSLYKMVDETSGLRDATPTVMRNISSSLQQLAQRENIPIVVTTQANRSGERVRRNTLADVAHSDSLAMDADLLIRIANFPTIERTVFLIKAAREIVLDGFATMNRCADSLGPYVHPDGTEDWDIPPGILGGEPSESDRGQQEPRGRFV